MKYLLSCLLFAFTAALASAADSAVYELRTYTAEPGKFADLITRLETVNPIFAKHGMIGVIFLAPLDEKDGAGNKVTYLLQHKSREAAGASWKAFQNDAEWQAFRAKNEASGKVVTKVDSVFLTPADYSPPVVTKSTKPGHVFELRTYTTPEGKLAGLDSRFRDYTMKIFEKHGMTNGAYFHPIDADKGASNTLVYWLMHDSREAAAASWKAFQADPEWVAVRTASEKDGKLTTGVKSIFLKPLDFSPIK